MRPMSTARAAGPGGGGIEPTAVGGGARREPSAVQVSCTACQASSTTRPADTHRGIERAHAPGVNPAVVRAMEPRLLGNCIEEADP
jgi:hypothetical protein